MAQHNKVCGFCGTLGHSKSYCPDRPRKAIPKVSAKKLAKDKLVDASMSLPKMPRKKKKEKTPRQKAKDAAWDAFSRYIRIRDSLLTTGTTEYCICVTCRERGDESWKESKHIQAGHAVGGRGNAVLFHEEIVNGQCDFCNAKAPYGLGGDYGNYAIYLVRTYGFEHAEALQRLKGTDKPYKLHDFIRIEQEYKDKTKGLLHEGN